mmetsp:Transcript_2085/g.3687  ORF Transcript_2085/g.3687 Transcript_2085/m.3687 type:complete len:82 (-) Transcript_2085:73-318(-)
MGLSNACSHLLGQSLSKREQVSNWERRPLRQSQQHYGALDAWILIPMFRKLKEEGFETADDEPTDSMSLKAKQKGTLSDKE